jgi:hypothetical protein
MPVNADAQNGLYVVYFLLTKKGNYDVSIKLNNREIDGSPFILKARSGQVTATKSTAEGDAISTFIAGTETNFIVFAKDANGNVLDDADPDFELSVALEWLSYTTGEKGNGYFLTINLSRNLHDHFQRIHIAHAHPQHVILPAPPSPSRHGQI